MGRAGGPPGRAISGDVPAGEVLLASRDLDRHLAVVVVLPQVKAAGPPESVVVEPAYVLALTRRSSSLMWRKRSYSSALLRQGARGPWRKTDGQRGQQQVTRPGRRQFTVQQRVAAWAGADQCAQQSPGSRFPSWAVGAVHAAGDLSRRECLPCTPAAGRSAGARDRIGTDSRGGRTYTTPAERPHDQGSHGGSSPVRAAAESPAATDPSRVHGQHDHSGEQAVGKVRVLLDPASPSSARWPTPTVMRADQGR